MAGVNKVILVGNLGIDPEVRTLESGVKVARLRIATTETYKNKEGVRVEQTEWHTVTLWRGLAEIGEKYLAKGKQVYIEGKLRTRSWKDNDGQDRYSTEIIADQMQMLGRANDADSSHSSQSSQSSSSRPQSSPQPAGESQYSNKNSDTNEDSDDLPF